MQIVAHPEQGDSSGQSFQCTLSEYPPTVVVAAIFTASILLWGAGCDRPSYPPGVQAALEKAGSNRGALASVLDRYHGDSADSLKLQAAYYVIENLPGHSYHQTPQIFNPIFDSTATVDPPKKRHLLFRDKMLEIKYRTPSKYNQSCTIKDIQKITASFLIENIELAFSAYHQLPDSIRPGFQQFITYILPYRASSEPLEPGRRKRAYLEYQWARNALQSGRSVPQVAGAVIDSMQIQSVGNTGYPGLFTSTQLTQLGFGTCNDMTNHLVNTLRAIGIPASIDLTPHWGNHYSMGHSWVAVHMKDSILALDAFTGDRLNNTYKEGSLPKVYRHTYSRPHDFTPFTQDVTTAYKPSNHITLAHRWDHPPKGATMYLMVFDASSQWVAVDQATRVTPDSLSFTNVGPHIAYMAGYYDQEGNIHPVNYPFIAGSNSSVKMLEPKTEDPLDSATIRQKYPPFFMRNTQKRRWSQKTFTIEAARTPSFTPSHILQTIHIGGSSHKQTIPLSYTGKYKYYRVRGPDTTKAWLAMLRLRSNSHPEIVAISPEKRKNKVQNLTDHNPLTYSGGQGFKVQYRFTEPTKIHTIKLQARNDGNHIRRGDRYELFYWSRGWQSLGKQIAKDTLLTYHKVPKNALYVLKNHSRGKEKTVFTLTADGRQWWPGVSRHMHQASP